MRTKLLDELLVFVEVLEAVRILVIQAERTSLRAGRCGGGVVWGGGRFAQKRGGGGAAVQYAHTAHAFSQ